MKTLLFIGGICCLPSIMAWAFSVPPANFTGTWIRDNNKVEGMKAPLPDLAWIITQDDKQISIRPTVGRKDIYNLDGTQTITEANDSHPPKTYTSRAKWLNDGKILELTMVSVSRGDIVIKPITLIVKDQLELADDGNQLKVYRTVEAHQEAITLNFQEIRFTFYKSYSETSIFPLMPRGRSAD